MRLKPNFFKPGDKLDIMNWDEFSPSAKAGHKTYLPGERFHTISQAFNKFTKAHEMIKPQLYEKRFFR